jgi:hypothetical protein
MLPKTDTFFSVSADKPAFTYSFGFRTTTPSLRENTFDPRYSYGSIPDFFSSRHFPREG